MTAPDFLTVLTCTPGHRCAKLYRDPAQKPEPYNAGFLFGVEEVPVSSLAELAEALDALRALPDCMVIRDRLKADARPAPNGLFARRRVDRPGDPAPFEAAEHRWAMFDADKTATAFDPADPQGSVKRWRAALPAALRGTGMVFQFSASQHLSPTVRGHAWVWLARPLGGVPLARWSIRNGLDPAVFHAVQPLYTADPLFAEGAADPLAPRWLVVLEGGDAELDLTEQDALEGALAGQGGMRLSSIALEEVGDPSEEGAEARERIAGQLREAFDGPGKRWDLCGHIGGAFANAGAPPEECCATLELLRAGDVADRDFAQGLQWALGAYSFSARPLGLKGMRELVGPVTTIKIGDALRGLAELYREPTPEEEAAALEPAPTWGSLPIDIFAHDTEPEPINFICSALSIGPGKPSAIVGYANNSKTPYALEFALFASAPVLAGKRFHGHTLERQARTLYLAAEGSRNARRKAAKLCKGHGLAFRDLAGRLEIGQAPPGFLTVEAAAELGELAIAGGYGLVVIDTYNSAFDGSKDRNTNDFSLALKVLGDISDRADITFLVLLHTRKGDPKKQFSMPTLQDIDGHNSIAGAIQAAVGLWRISAKSKHRIGVCCVREVDAAFDTYEIDWKDTPGADGEGLRAELVAGDEAEPRAADTSARDEAEAVAEILAMVDADGWTTWRAVQRAPLGKGLDRQALLAALVREGVLLKKTVASGGDSSHQYSRPGRSAKVAEAEAKRGWFGKK